MFITGNKEVFLHIDISSNKFRILYNHNHMDEKTASFKDMKN